MKTIKILSVFLTVLTIILLSFGCVQRAEQPEKATSIVETEEENTITETITETVTETISETATETVIETETETVVETSTETEVTPSTTETNLTQQEAIDIAMGVAKGDVDRIETEIEDGKLIWKIRIISNGTRTDVSIVDATSEVIRVDIDDD